MQKIEIDENVFFQQVEMSDGHLLKKLLKSSPLEIIARVVVVSIAKS